MGGHLDLQMKELRRGIQMDLRMVPATRKAPKLEKRYYWERPRANYRALERRSDLE
jgi:hypothetical protein